MTLNQNEEYAKLIDCGDGVPALDLDVATQPAPAALPKEQPRKQPEPEETETLLPVRTAAVLATIVAQIAIGLGVIVGANPLIAGFAALALLATGVGLAFADLITKQF